MSARRNKLEQLRDQFPEDPEIRIKDPTFIFFKLLVSLSFIKKLESGIKKIRLSLKKKTILTLFKKKF